MTTVQIALPDEVFSTMHMSPGEVADEMRVAAATVWYAKGLISQGQDRIPGRRGRRPGHGDARNRGRRQSRCRGHRGKKFIAVAGRARC